MFSEWLVEAYYLKTFLQLSHVPHFTTLQKFTERISGTLLGKLISSFIILTKIGQLFVGIDSSGFNESLIYEKNCHWNHVTSIYFDYDCTVIMAS